MPNLARAVVIKIAVVTEHARTDTNFFRANLTGARSDKDLRVERLLHP